MSLSRTYVPNPVKSPETLNSANSILNFFQNRISGTHPSNPSTGSRTDSETTSSKSGSNLVLNPVSNSSNPYAKNSRASTNYPISGTSPSSVKVDLEKLHNDPVSQVTQAAQVLDHSLVWNYQKLPNGNTQCFLKFIDGEKSEDPDYEPIFGQGVHGDKKHAKMKAAELVLAEIIGKWGDWKEIQEKNKKSKKKKYQSEYRLRQDRDNKERIEKIETKERSTREKRPRNDSNTSRDRGSDRDRSRERSPSRRKTSVETDSRSSRSGSSSRYGSEYSRRTSYDRGHDRYREKTRR